MDSIEEFTEWAIARGLKLNGVAAHRFPGRGLGIIAEKTLKAGDTLLKVPMSFLRTQHTVPKRISSSLKGITVHGLLAAEFSLDTSPARAPWRAVLPSKSDMQESMPLMWATELQALLPSAASALLEKQKAKIAADWALVSSAFPDLDYSTYSYNWSLVNTRTFYYTSSSSSSSRTKGRPQKSLPRDDCLAFIPYADFFNHSSLGCEVLFTAHGYEIASHRKIEKGEEVFISYGNHGNDFLCVEYGFILADGENRWDEVALDEILVRLFDAMQKEQLKEAGFWQKYVLDARGVCYRTQVALRLLCVPVNRWTRMVASGVEEGDVYQGRVNEILGKELKKYMISVQERIGEVKRLECGLASQRDVLGRRWEQIRLLIGNAIARMGS